MKAVLALTLLAVLGFVAAACGATKHFERVNIGMGPGSTTVSGTTTISQLDVGTLVRCKDGPAAKVPRQGVGISKTSSITAVSATTTTSPPVAGQIEITNHQNGSVTVICTPSK